MFPSCGYFSSFPCPFFLNGLCERPYCHFRHSKHDIEKAKEEAPISYSTTDETDYSTTTTSTSVSSVASPVNSTPTSVVSERQADTIDANDVYFTSGATEKELPPPPSLSQEQEASSFSIPSFTDNSKYQVPIAEEPEQYLTASPEKTQEQNGSKYPLPNSGPPSLPTYLPTPKTPSLPAPEPVKDVLGVPVYQPTPKRDLKRKHGDQAKSKARAKGTDLEYDPESNFSCAGLTNSSQEPQKEEEEDAVDYQPSKKKGRGSGGRNTRLSLDSLMGSPDGAGDGAGDGDSEDQEMPDGQFSDDEPDERQSVKKMEEDDDEEKDEGSENFENIGDDDISSDEEFVEVPDFPGGDPLAKNNKNSAKSEGSKTPRTSLEKGSKSSSVTKTKTTIPSGSSKSTKQEQRRTSSDGSSKPLKSKSEANKAAPEKSSKSSSHKKTTSSSSSSGKVVHSKENSQKSSSTSSSSGKVYSSDKTHQSSKHSLKDKQGLSQQSEGAKIKHRSESSSSRSASAEKHASSKISATQGTSSKSSLSSSKQSSSKSDAERRSSSESKGSVVRHSSSSPKGEKGSKESSGQKVLSVKHSSSASKSSSEKHSSLGASGAKHSHSNHKTSSSNRHSSVDSKSGEHRAHSKSSESGRKDSSTKSSSKEKSFNGAKSHSGEKTSKEHSSSGTKLHRKNSASSTSSGHGKKQKPDSSSHHKSEKSLSKKSDSDSKNSSKLLERMNSNLFGESDSDDQGSGLPGTSCDEVELIEFDEPTATKEVQQEQEIDYSQFIHDSDFEDEDTFDECLRIFKEGAPQKKIGGQTEKKLVKDMKAEGSSQGEASSFAPGKKRTAHKAAEQARKPGLQKKERPRHILSPTEVMHNRIMEMQRRALERATKLAVQEQEVSSTSGSSSAASRPQSANPGGEKKRVAHTPKPVAPPTASKKKPAAANPEGKVTLAVTASKTEKRVAHTPNLTNLKRPVIPASFGSKVPSNIRQRYLNLIIDECLKFCANEEEAYKKALEEETGVYDRASNKNIYLRVAVNTITRLRAEAKESMPGSSNSKQRRSSLTQSHQATLGGSKAAKTSFTLHRSTGAGKKVEVPLTAVELYQKMEKYTLTKEQLEANGYPLPSPDTPGKAVMVGKRYQDKDALLKSNERTCCRCGKRFIVNADGSYAFSEECVYHWTRAYPRKKSGFIQHIYNCCNSDTSTQGCQVAANHVHEQNKNDELSGFMQTMPRSPPRDGNYGIYALDCEMVYTQGGLELARVTVVDVEGESVFESLVRPFNPIVDYNTRFSGITAADLKGVETTLTDVQAILLNRFSDKTILIGHSLESDLFALKLIHMTVVDTSVVFPHRLGPPYKRALKNLMLETFQKIIQCDDGGHDSKEDAVACLQLMKWRIKEDSKREQRYS